MKFHTLRNFILKISLGLILLSLVSSLANNVNKKEQAKSLGIPRINDIKQDFLTQNTARYILENGLAKSDVENNPSRYKILTAQENMQNSMVSTIYDKDQKAYYGDVSQSQKNAAQGYTVIPKSAEANSRYLNKVIYQKDQKPYYGNDRDFRVLSNAPTDRVAVPIEMKDMTYTFPDQKNIRTLEKKLNQINAKESLNSISMTGKYMKDPNPYYDPTLYDKAAKTSTIVETINNMKKDLTYDGPVFTEENFPVKTKIQNIANASKEGTNNLIADSYHYDVNRNQTPKHNFAVAEEAVTPKHDLVEVEITGVTLGSKYYENTKKPHLIEADSKDNPTRNVEVSEKATKFSDRKVEEVKKTEKKVEKKVEKKEEKKVEQKIEKAVPAKAEIKKENKIKEEERLTEKIIEKAVELKSEKKNLRSGPLFEGFRLQMAKDPNLKK